MFYATKKLLSYTMIVIKLQRRILMNLLCNMEASEPKRVNPVLNIIWVNLLRLGGLHINWKLKTWSIYSKINHKTRLFLMWIIHLFIFCFDIRTYYCTSATLNHIT